MSLLMLFYHSCHFVNGDVMLLLLFLMCLMCCGQDRSVVVVVATTIVVVAAGLCCSGFSFALVFYVVAVAVMMVLDLWFLGDVHMNEVRIIGFFELIPQ